MPVTKYISLQRLNLIYVYKKANKLAKQKAMPFICIRINSLAVLAHYFIYNVIKKGGGIRPYETLATLYLLKKVLHSILYLGIDNEDA